MVAVVVHQANAFDLGALLDDGGRALDLQILDQQHAVAVSQRGAVGVFDDAGGAVVIGSHIGLGRPFMAAVGADQQGAVGVGVVQAALGAGGQGGVAHITFAVTKAWSVQGRAVADCGGAEWGVQAAAHRGGWSLLGSGHSSIRADSGFLRF